MSKEKQTIYKPKAISGFPEWLPEERLVEQRWFDHIRKTFESYGFCSIETPSVEEIDVLLAKGEVDKEIYVLERLHKDEDSDKDARLALHFDQTVPFARYTAQHFNELVFPFKRYQIGRVWRGERPQMGRMREFYQCDIDVINVDNLPLHFDAEVAAMAYEALAGLNVGKVQLRISNRKILIGVLKANDHIEDVGAVLSAIDKFEKIGEEETKVLIAKALYDEHDIAEVEFIFGIIKDGPIAIPNELMTEKVQEGIKELDEILSNLKHLPDGAVKMDLSIVRGLDYYTGTVYETQLLDVPEFTGSVCSGGRYDDLAGTFIKKKLPGVGISIGFSRLFDVIRQTRPELLNIGAKSPTDILIYTEDKDINANDTAQILRKRGLNVEVFHTVKKWDKHFKYASKKLIPYIWYVSKNGHEVKNLTSDEKTKADPKTWSKDE